MSRIFRSATVLLLLLNLNSQCSNLFAQGTEFTYQGRLSDGGGPANGTYDICASLYTTNASGTIFAGPVTNSPVTVSNGLFTIPLDFGNVFNGTALSGWKFRFAPTAGALSRL